MKEYDLIIIGGGPAGLTAAIYACRARLNSLLIEKEMIGGLITFAGQIDNFPGFPEGINGMELAELMHRQATKYGLETVSADVTGVRLQGEPKVITTTDGDFTANAVIIASGSERQKLGVPGEEKFTGKGVSYCATCDACFFSEQPVAVVGGGNAALNEALELAKFASRVTIIHRRDQLRATRILQEKALGEPKIEPMWNTVVEEIEGDDVVRKLKLHDVVSGEKSTLAVSGVFISVGLKPNTDFVNGLLRLDETGHIVTNERMETEISGVFAAGDVRHNSIQQAIAAAGDGAVAAISAEKSLSR